MHPSFCFIREYYVETDKKLSESNIFDLLKGVPINNNQIGKFDSINSLDISNKYIITLSTGKNREIRNSLKYLNINTLNLHRSKYASLELDDMKEGEYRYLTDKEKLIF